MNRISAEDKPALQSKINPDCRVKAGGPGPLHTLEQTVSQSKHGGSQGIQEARLTRKCKHQSATPLQAAGVCQGPLLKARARLNSWGQKTSRASGKDADPGSPHSSRPVLHPEGQSGDTALYRTPS